MLTGCIIYGIFLLLFLIWTLINLWEKWNQIIEPVSSNGFDIQNFQQLIYPAITICNVVPNVRLRHNKCMSYETDIKCDYSEHIDYGKKKSFINNDRNKNSHCLTYNNNIDNAFVATKLGTQDMLIISLSINITSYPRGSFLSGVYISLHSQDKSAPTGHSALLASPGEIFLVRLKKSVNEFLNSTTSIESFDAKISTLGSYNFESSWGYKNDTVVLAFTYQDLNVMIVRELPPYNILTFLSETGGVLGLLLGTSIVNLIIFLIQWGWGLRLNEFKWFSVQNKHDSAYNNNMTILTEPPNSKSIPNEEKSKDLIENFCLV
jgi:hypothetical protein